ncbi:MAG: Na+/H+ antiporter subunit C [Natronospirillum sp.]|uniref:Na+/H+ antiporter subunit C n=1 Tax=Natronospirillum sp. TaxID=2812955 RepID=UPI0025CC8A4B|nr:Na+/H+ antiporter subunit C [Natronospirillum sp.]MCH8551423.1 Na+/H+ antiporter subunit C [Natronospirillum sp.]
MELLFSVLIAILTGTGIYLLLRARTFPVVMGVALISYAVNLFLLAMGRLRTGQPAIIGTGESYTDPLPQALVLTAIVIGFAMTAFVTVLALRARGELGNDHVDGFEERGREQERQQSASEEKPAEPGDDTQEPRP